MRNVSKPLSDAVPREEYVSWIEVTETCPTLHQQECSLTVSRGHYPIVPASFVNLSTAMDQIEALDFRLGRLIENVRLIRLITHVAFDAPNCSVEPQWCRAYTTEPL